MKNTILIIIIGILVIGGFIIFLTGGESDVASTSVSETEVNATAVESFDKAPDFSLKDYNGNLVSLSDFVGRPMIINSWAAWCPFCRKELVDFAIAQKEFGDSVVIIAIDRAESLNTAKKYSDELGVSDDFIFLLDPSDSFYKSIGGFSMPETIFVDAEGNIRHHKRGPMNVAEISQRAQQLFNL